MRLKTRLAEKLGIEHPILLAPMNVLAGREACCRRVQRRRARHHRRRVWLTPIGSTSSSRKRGMQGWLRVHHLVDGDGSEASRSGSGKQPAALMLSFGDVEPHVAHQSARSAADLPGTRYEVPARSRRCGVDIIVAEGCEAGGHSGYRGVSRSFPKPPTISQSARPIPHWSRQAAWGRTRSGGGAHAWCGRRSCRNALRREPGVGSVGGVSPGDHPC
jgi:nitronate monooxygenase